MTKTMTDALRRGLTRLQAYADRESSNPELDIAVASELHSASGWIEQQLDADQAIASQQRRASERSAAGLCPRCGDTDPQCICYAR